MGMGILIPWGILLIYQGYAHGVKPQKMPEPFYFIGATGTMGIAALIAMANSRVGILFAWAMLAGALVLVYNDKPISLQPKKVTGTKTAEVTA